MMAAAIGLLVGACQAPSNTNETRPTDTLPTPTAQSVPENSHQTSRQCYAYRSGKDTILLRLQEEEGKVTGELAYRLYEKDRNQGVLAGQLKGDTLLAEYRFQSEGSPSVRQVAFLKKGDAYLEGFGEVEEREGKTVFKDVKTLSFTDNMGLRKEECLP
jgi:hypothetical protein